MISREMIPMTATPATILRRVNSIHQQATTWKVRSFQVICQEPGFPLTTNDLAGSRFSHVERS